MNFTPQTILDLQKGFSLLFDAGRLNDAVPVLWDSKAIRVDTPGIEINVYGWIAEMPQFREWVGPRVAKRLSSRSHQIKNTKKEFSYAVGRDDIKYDRFGVYNQHATMAGLAARRLWDQYLTALQLTGETALCYDGQFFYDTDHLSNPDDSSSAQFANLFTARPLTAQNVGYVFAQMASIKDANGEPMLATPDTLEFGPDLREDAMVALNAELIAQSIKNVAGTENVGGASQNNVGMARQLKPLYNDRLPAGAWYLHHTTMMKPFVVQVETEPVGLEARVDANDPHVWDLDEFLFGSRACGGVGFALPQLSAKVKTT
jgi:phage major head subunit gpT-like protein